MSVTQKQIADKLGVSRPLVVLALSDHPSVAEKSRARIKAMALKMGYQPNHAARTLARGRAETVALWIAGKYTPHYARVVRSTEIQLKQNRYELIVSDLAGRGAGEGSLISSRWPVDGILVMDAPWHVNAYLRTHPGRRLPCVSMGAYCSDETDSIAIDLFSGAVAAVEHLVNRGGRRIVHLTPTLENNPGEARRYAYTKVLKKAGLTPEFIVVTDQSRATAREAVREHIRAHGCPDAIFCHNDDMAIGAYRGVYDMGLRVPEDVALMGCDGIEDTEYLPCPISTIVQPIEEMCALGGGFLRNRMEKPRTALQRAMLKPTLAIRDSSMPAQRLRKVGKIQNSFTLIELLVVVAIISVLAAMLLPALKSAKESALGIKCMNNLKQVETAVIMYADENNGWTPHYAWNGQGPWQPSWIGLLTNNNYIAKPALDKETILVCPRQKPRVFVNLTGFGAPAYGMRIPYNGFWTVPFGTFNISSSSVIDGVNASGVQLNN